MDEIEVERLFGRETAGHEYRELISRHEVFELTSEAICEIRHYLAPPARVKEVMSITLILLGYKEEESKEWDKVLQVLKKMGKDGFKRYIERRASLVPLKTAEKARVLLANIKLEDIQNVSSATIAFYVWATAMISRAIVARRH